VGETRGGGPGRPARRIASGAVAALIAVTVVSCSAVPPEAPGATGTSPPVTTGGAAPPAAMTAPDLPRVVLAPPRLSEADAPGLVSRFTATAAADLAVAVRWATPPGRSPLGDLLDDRVEQVARDFAAAHGAGWVAAPDVVPGGNVGLCRGATLGARAGATLSVDCSIVTAAGPLLGERVTIIRREAGAAASVTREVWYADAATGGVYGGASLYAPGRESRVLALVAEGLRASGRIRPGADPFAGLGADAQRAILADSAVTPAGVVITSALAADAGRAVSVHVPGRLLGPMLSDQGRAALDAAAAGGPYAPGGAAVGDDPVDCSFVPCVSITFDDGPSSLTPTLLDVLDRERVVATFFVQGSAVQASPDVAARIVASGHQIGNHTWRHPNLTKLTNDEVKREVARTQQAIASATGASASSMRPPYGASNAKVRSLVGLPVIVWDIDTRDWEDPGADVVVDRAVTQSSRGSIVLMHDTHQQTVDAVPAIIAGLRGRGFALSTVAGQFGGGLPGPGTLVSHGPR
jgi:peptidoglycan/xylan/chitin deacetylase (PgdA/CDA1 family)